MFICQREFPVSPYHSATTTIQTSLCSVATQSYPTVCDPMDCSPPGSSVHGILQQEHWSGLPFPTPGDLPNPGIEPTSAVFAALAGGPLLLSHLGSPQTFLYTPIIQIQITPLYAIADVTHLHHLFLKKSSDY